MLNLAHIRNKVGNFNKLFRCTSTGSNNLNVIFMLTQEIHNLLRRQHLSSKHNIQLIKNNNVRSVRADSFLRLFPAVTAHLQIHRIGIMEINKGVASHLPQRKPEQILRSPRLAVLRIILQK